MSDQNAPAMTALNPAEKTRTYVYPDGSKLTYSDVTAIGVRPSGTHRLELQDGRKIIVLPGWRAVELDMEKWTL